MAREVLFYDQHFFDLYNTLDLKTKLKIDWTLELLETIEKIPEKYFKFVSNTYGLFEIRVEYESNIYRIFSFFDSGNKLIVINGFIKKSNKTPKRDLKKAINIKSQYFNEIDVR